MSAQQILFCFIFGRLSFPFYVNSCVNCILFLQLITKEISVNIRINDPGKSYIHVVMKTMDDNFLVGTLILVKFRLKAFCTFNM